jgi:hypothetical protein
MVQVISLQLPSLRRPIVEVVLCLTTTRRLPKACRAKVLSDLRMGLRGCLHVFDEHGGGGICERSYTNIDAVDRFDVNGAAAAVIPFVA